MAAETVGVGRGRRGRRLLVVLGLVAGVGGGGAALYAFSSASAVPKQISYRGRMYMGVVEVTPFEVRANVGRLHAGGETIDGAPLFVSGGATPAVVAVRLSDGHFNAYQLMR